MVCRDGFQDGGGPRRWFGIEEGLLAGFGIERV